MKQWDVVSLLSNTNIAARPAGSSRAAFGQKDIPHSSAIAYTSDQKAGKNGSR